MGMIYEESGYMVMNKLRYLEDNLSNGSFVTLFVPSENTRLWFKMVDNKTESFTARINEWLLEQNIEYPFTNEEDRLLFELTWG